MKNNFNATKELLEKGKNISLSVSERDEMKSTLLSYALFHGMKEKSEKSIFTVSTIWIRTIASASLMFVLFIGTGYASASSLPGEFLYPVKTNVVEELTAATKINPLSRLEYQHERYETRLFELKTLSERGPILITALQDSQIELIELTEEMNELMAGEDEIEDTVALELVGDMVAMSNATEAILRSGTTQEQLDVFEGVTDDLEQIHDNEIVDLLDNSTSTIELFIQDQLSEISSELAEDDLEEIITVRVTDFVEDAELSLEEENYKEVVNLVADAVTLIEAREYIDDYQDEIAE